jgi:hypothetical protein
MNNLPHGLEQNNEYFVNGYVFHTEEYGHGKKTYNSGVCIKGSTSSEFEVDYYGRLEEVIELQYHSEQNRVLVANMLYALLVVLVMPTIMPTRSSGSLRGLIVISHIDG